MKRLTKLTTLGLALALCLTAVVPVLAQTDTTQEANNTGTKESTVTINSSSSFKVTVPSTITISQSSKALLNETYNVKVEGDITGTETIKVVPDGAFNLSQSGKTDIPVTVNQPKTDFTYDEINVTNGCTTTGTLTTTNEVTAGTWTGNLTFNINVETPSTGSGNASLPSKVPNGTIVPVSTYSWIELQAISKDIQNNGSSPTEYGINIDTMTKDQLTKDGFTLVDAGTDAGDYPGFVFYGQLSTTGRGINSDDTNTGGYASSRMIAELEGYYNGNTFLGVTINPDIKAVIKPVDIICNTGKTDYTAGTKTNIASGVHVFLPSINELGRYNDLRSRYPWYSTHLPELLLEGNTFDYYKGGAGYSGNHAAIQAVDYSWVRSADAYNTNRFWDVRPSGNVDVGWASYKGGVCAAFVI